MIKALIINTVLKLASSVLITLMTKGVEELQKRQDNDLYEQGDSIKDVLNRIKLQ